WIVIQQRIDGSQSFNQIWNVYKSGFGLYHKNFWLGLEKMHQLTTSADYRLRFEILISGSWFSDEYDHFKIGSEIEKYIVNVSKYNGDKCDIMNHPDPNYRHNGMNFSAPDQDNDPYPNYHCAKSHGSGNWFHCCYYQRVNGIFGSSFDYCYKVATYSRMMIKIN
ncbi:hypothetical protein HELRODRAFT_81437, partial [Helobdella robusta]|uniref:Fibrinogen C-terminal domain-containing protein n=1 Tax=Helobdella robusta TaxID=6412 RepID=T1G4E3_HELRO